MDVYNTHTRRQDNSTSDIYKKTIPPAQLRYIANENNCCVWTIVAQWRVDIAACTYGGCIDC